MTGNGFGEDDPTPPGPQLPPEVRYGVASIDNFRTEILHVAEQLQELRREWVEFPERHPAFFEEKVIDIKEGHVVRMLEQIDEDKTRIRKRKA